MHAGVQNRLTYIRNQSWVIEFRSWCSSPQTGSWVIHTIQGQIQGVCLWFHPHFTKKQVNYYFPQIIYVKILSKDLTKKVVSKEWKQKCLQIQNDPIRSFSKDLSLQRQFHMHSIDNISINKLRKRLCNDNVAYCNMHYVAMTQA